MIIHRVISDLLTSNMYIVAEGTSAIIVDPCRNTEMPEGVEPDLIILTHEHYDHISGVNAWKSRYGVKVLCSRQCNERIQNPTKNMARYFEAFCALQEGLDKTLPDDFDPGYKCEADEVYETEKEFIWKGHLVRLFTLPGHSPGSSGILIDRCLFAGDSVFEHQETVLRFPGGSEKDWKEISLPKLMKLPKDTIVYPGHYNHFNMAKWFYFSEGTDGVF